MAKADKPRRNSYGAMKPDDQIFSFSRKKAIEFFRRECEVRNEKSEPPTKPPVIKSESYNCKQVLTEPKYTFLDNQSHVHEPDYCFRGTRLNSATDKSMSLDRGHSLVPSVWLAGDPHTSKEPARRRNPQQEHSLHESRFKPIKTIQQMKGRHQKAKSLDQSSRFGEPKESTYFSQQNLRKPISSKCYRPEEKHGFQDPRNPSRDAGKRLPELGNLCGKGVSSSSVDCVRKSPEPRPKLQGMKPIPNKQKRWGVDRTQSLQGARNDTGQTDAVSVGQTKHLSFSDYNVSTKAHGLANVGTPQFGARCTPAEKVFRDWKLVSAEFQSKLAQSGRAAKDLKYNFPECKEHASKVRGPRPTSPELLHNGRANKVSQEHRSRTLDRDSGLPSAGHSNQGTDPRLVDPTCRRIEHGEFAKNPGSVSHKSKPLHSAFSPPATRYVPREAKCMSLDRRCGLPEKKDGFLRAQNPAVSAEPGTLGCRWHNGGIPRRRNSFQRPRGRLWDNQYSYQEIRGSFQKHCPMKYPDMTTGSVDRVDKSQEDVHNLQKHKHNSEDQTYSSENQNHSSENQKYSPANQKHSSGNQKYGLPIQKNRLQNPQYSQANQRYSLQEPLPRPQQWGNHLQKSNNSLQRPASDAGFVSWHPEYQKVDWMKVERIARSVSTITQNGSFSGSGGEDAKTLRKNGSRKSNAAKPKKSSKLVNGQKVVHGPNHHGNRPDINLQTSRSSHQKVRVGHKRAGRKKGKLRGFDLISCCYGIPSRQDHHDDRVGEAGDRYKVRFLGCYFHPKSLT